MRRIDIDSNTCETFDSITELLDTLDRRDYKCDGGHHRGQRERYDKRWAGYTSYEDACSAMRHGRQQDVRALNIRPAGTATGQAPQLQRAVVGALPCVPAYIIGQPDSMYKIQQVRRVSPVVVLNIDIAQNAGTSRSEMLEYGRQCVAYIKALELQGRRVRVYAVACLNDAGERAVLRLLVKKETQALDIKRLTFPLCDSAMLRIIGFEWYEKTDLCKHETWRYGSAVGRDEPETVDFITACDRQAVYVNHYTDFDSLQI